MGSRLNEYQSNAEKTIFKDLHESIPYYGLGSEAAGLMSIYKKALRDEEPEDFWISDLEEEVGDCLWYLSTICSQLGWKLSDCGLNKLNTFACHIDLEAESHTFDEFQHLCEELRTEKEQSPEIRKTVSLLGIVAEAGKVLYKYQLLNVRKSKKLGISELTQLDIGTILWYLSDISTVFKLNLTKAAEKNELKRNSLFSKQKCIADYDAKSLPYEKLPKKLNVFFLNIADPNSIKPYCKIVYNNVYIGDRLDDNSHIADGYRFHDVIHLAHMAILGWSPVCRALLKVKRKSNYETDSNEDGQRAIIIEEAVVALNYQYAKRKGFFKATNNISTSHLKMIKSLVQDLEIREATLDQWKNVITTGFQIYAQLIENSGGLVEIDMNTASIKYLKVDSKEYFDGSSQQPQLNTNDIITYSESNLH